MRGEEQPACCWPTSRVFRDPDDDSIARRIDDGERASSQGPPTVRPAGGGGVVRTAKSPHLILPFCALMRRRRPREETRRRRGWCDAAAPEKRRDGVLSPLPGERAAVCTDKVFGLPQLQQDRPNFIAVELATCLAGGARKQTSRPETPSSGANPKSLSNT